MDRKESQKHLKGWLVGKEKKGKFNEGDLPNHYQPLTFQNI